MNQKALIVMKDLTNNKNSITIVFRKQILGMIKKLIHHIHKKCMNNNNKLIKVQKI